MSTQTYSTADLLLALLGKTNELQGAIKRNTHLLASQELERLRQDIRQRQPANPAGYGWKSYSQNDEDGIIRYCLQKLAENTHLEKTFVEIGIGRGYENNSYQLLLDGFSGCWVDGNSEFIAQVRPHVPTGQRRLLVHETFVTLENIQETIAVCRSFLRERSVDFFSLDVDGNDYHFLPSCLALLQPKLVCVEYNGKFPPPTALHMRYNPTYVWDRTDYQGASLQDMANVMRGYTLVACSVVGINAFFVRDDLCTGFTPYTIEELYQPARMELLAIPQGHPPAHSWLRQALKTR